MARPGLPCLRSTGGSEPPKHPDPSAAPPWAGDPRRVARVRAEPSPSSSRTQSAGPRERLDADQAATPALARPPARPTPAAAAPAVASRSPEPRAAGSGRRPGRARRPGSGRGPRRASAGRAAHAAVHGRLGRRGRGPRSRGLSGTAGAGGGGSRRAAGARAPRAKAETTEPPRRAAPCRAAPGRSRQTQPKPSSLLPLGPKLRGAGDQPARRGPGTARHGHQGEGARGAGRLGRSAPRRPRDAEEPREGRSRVSAAPGRRLGHRSGGAPGGAGSSREAALQSLHLSWPRRPPRDGKFPQPRSRGPRPEAAARRLPLSLLRTAAPRARGGRARRGGRCSLPGSRAPRPLPSSLSFFPSVLPSFRFEWDVFRSE